MTFYQKFLNLCIEKGVTPSQAAMNVGVSKAAVTRWKNGSIPSDMIVMALSKYFGTTFDDLSKDGDLEKIEALEYLSQEQKGLLAVTDGMTAEDIKLMISFAERLKNGTN